MRQVDGSGDRVKPLIGKDISIVLSAEDMALAKRVGLIRNAEDEKQGLEHIAGFVGDGSVNHVVGCYGELAYSRAKGVPWSGLDTFKKPDVGQDEVRTTTRPNGRLIIRPDDSSTAPFVLVVWQPPTGLVCGWIRGAAARREQWWGQLDPRRPYAWNVPQGALDAFPITEAGGQGLVQPAINIRIHSPVAHITQMALPGLDVYRRRD